MVSHLRHLPLRGIAIHDFRLQARMLQLRVRIAIALTPQPAHIDTYSPIQRASPVIATLMT
jgi:hypothetical protein